MPASMLRGSVTEARLSPRGMRFVLVSSFLVAALPAAAADFIRGDVDGDGRVGERDVVALAYHLDKRKPMRDCADAGDCDDDGDVDAKDFAALASFVFSRGEAPPRPFPGCGQDPTADRLSCNDAGECPSAKASEPLPFAVDRSIEQRIRELQPFRGARRRVAALRNPDGLVEHFVTGQLIVRAKDERELADFAKRWGGEVIADGCLPEMPPNEEAKMRDVPDSPFALVQVSLDAADESRLDADARSLGIKGVHAVSTEEGRRLIAILLRSILEGWVVFADMPAETHLQEHPTSVGGFFDPELCGNAFFPEVCDVSGSGTRVNRTWEYMRTLGETDRPFVALIDRGFAVDANGSPSFGNQDLPPVSSAMRWHFPRGSGDVSGPNVEECFAGSGNGTCWHATATTNIATATHDNQFGTAGTAPRAQPMYFYSSSYFEMADAIRTALRQGANVINISMGGYCGGLCNTFGIFTGEDTLSDATWVAGSSGVPVVASAGNDGLDLGSDRLVPCVLPGVLCVGALKQNSLSAADASDWGGGSNFGARVDIWAPGTNLQVPGLPQMDASGNWVPNTSIDSAGLDSFSGTSAAAPFVSGVVASMKAFDPSLTTGDVRLTFWATSQASSDPKVSGNGAIDALGAVVETNLGRAAATIESPAPGSTWDVTVDLAVRLVPGTAASAVEYWARYRETPSGSPTQRRLATVTSGGGFDYRWDVSALPEQHNVQVWGIIEAPSGFSSVTRESSGVRIRVDSVPPAGQITAPVSGGVYGADVPLVAMVSDDRSGPDRVEFRILSASGAEIGREDADAAHGFATTWRANGHHGETVTVSAVAYDRNGNAGALPDVPGVVIDIGRPTVTMVYPPQMAVDAVWITTNGSIQVRAQANDPSGIAEVEFTAYYRDAAGSLVSSLIGVDSVPNFYGEYSAIWNLAGVPDQADRTFPYDIQVEAVAIDQAGNASYSDIGWIIGIDRAAPAVQVLQPAHDLTVQSGPVAIEIDCEDAVGPFRLVHEITVTASYSETYGGPATAHELVHLTNGGYWTGSLDVTQLPEQTVQLTVHAADDAGNVREVVRRIIIDRSGPVLTQLGHGRDPYFSGGPLTQSISYRVSEWAPFVAIAIDDAAGDPVWGTVEHNVGTDPRVVLWDGRDRFGQHVPSGAYSYRFDVSDAAGNTSQVAGGTFQVVLDTTAPSLALNVAATWSLGAPDPLEIEWDVDEKCRVEVEVRNAAGNVIRYVGSWDATPGPTTVTWDGRTSLGAAVPPGAYTVRARAADPAGNRSEEDAPVTVTP